MTFGLAVTLVLAVVAFLERNAAERQQVIAESRELNARAINALGTDPLRAMLLAMRRVGDTRRTK